MGPPPEPLETGPRGGPRLAAPFPEWMIGLSAGYVTAHVARNPALTMIGNGVMPQQCAAAVKLLLGIG